MPALSARRCSSRAAVRRNRIGSDAACNLMALAPRIMPDTDIGKHAVAGYSRYLGISEADFLESMASPPTSSDVATRGHRAGNESWIAPREERCMVSGKGLEAVP